MVIDEKNGSGIVIEETADQLITYEPQPNGGQVPIIDPYDGCSIRCPYCFQMNDPDWNKAIRVKTDIDSLIQHELKHWPKNETIYLGSRCDPYMTLEATYKLTRKCLVGLKGLGIATMITTKGNIDLIRRDIDIYREFGTTLTVLLGFSRLSDYLGKKTGFESRLQLVKELTSNDIQVWVFVTPVLPGITDVECIKRELPEEIPIFLDYLRIDGNNRRKHGMRAFIHKHFPELLNEYDQILNGGEQRYYIELFEQYGENKRFEFLFRE